MRTYKKPYKSRSYEHSSSKDHYSFRKTGNKDLDYQTEQVVQLLNHGKEKSALQLAIHYGTAPLIALASGAVRYYFSDYWK